MAWLNRGLKDMTSMSGLRQELLQDLSNTPGAHGAWRIEPAEPETPPAHFLSRLVGEDAMGRSGHFFRPCWLGAGGEALVVRNWWRGWWLGLSWLIRLVRCALNFEPLFLYFVDDLGSKANRRVEKRQQS